MAQEVFVAREGGVAALNAVSNRTNRGNVDYKTFKDVVTRNGYRVIDDDGEENAFAEKKSGDVIIQINNPEKGYSVVAYEAGGNGNLLEDKIVRTLNEAIKVGERYSKTVFASYEPRLYEIKLSNGQTLKKEGVDLENIQENFAQGWRELFGTYDGMPDFKTVKQHKLK